jgi:hypothetical protein
MEALTPASADDLPPLGELLVDDPFWQYPAWGLAREGVGHLRVWAAAAASLGYLAVVTDTDGIVSVTESAGRIWADLARRYGPSVVLLEHHLAPGSGEGAETLDLVRIGADGSPHWLRIWPTGEDNPRHAGLERWMATDGYQIVSRPASWFDRCEGEDGRSPGSSPQAPGLRGPHAGGALPLASPCRVTHSRGSHATRRGLASGGLSCDALTCRAARASQDRAAASTIADLAVKPRVITGSEARVAG